MKNVIKEIKNNKAEAETLIDYAKIECNDVKNVIPILDAILSVKNPERLKGWNWKVAKFIADKTSYISVEIDPDVDFEEGEWGLPIVTGGLLRICLMKS